MLVFFSSCTFRNKYNLKLRDGAEVNTRVNKTVIFTVREGVATPYYWTTDIDSTNQNIKFISRRKRFHISAPGGSTTVIFKFKSLKKGFHTMDFILRSYWDEKDIARRKTIKFNVK